MDRFKAALGLRTNSIDEAQRQRLYGVLASGIVFRPLTGNDLLLAFRPVIAEMDVAFDNAFPRWVDVTSDHNGRASDCNLNPTDCSMKDLKTGLTWSQYQGAMNWNKASGQCDNLNDSGHDD